MKVLSVNFKTPLQQTNKSKISFGMSPGSDVASTMADLINNSGNFTEGLNLLSRIGALMFKNDGAVGNLTRIADKQDTFLATLTNKGDLTPATKTFNSPQEVFEGLIKFFEENIRSSAN